MRKVVQEMRTLPAEPESTDRKTGVDLLYGHAPGRVLIKLIMKSGLPGLVSWFLGTGLSRPLIGHYIRRHRIDMSDFAGQSYDTFQAFFARKRKTCPVDTTQRHLISPCDGMLSVYPIREDSVYPVKGSKYRLQELVDEEALAQLFESGICLIFRLQATDYHHFCYIDDGFQYTNHFVEGTLHSVQPAACEKVPVYRLNRRMWTLMETEHFGKVIQIGVGAFLVGEIVHEASCCDFRKSQEMGHFELAGSTVVQLFQEDRIRLREDIRSRVATGEEIRVRMGEMIGTMR